MGSLASSGPTSVAIVPILSYRVKLDRGSALSDYHELD